jgi:peptidyl-prolyl cis-trans isomerase B (cyclophilin B)
MNMKTAEIHTEKGILKVELYENDAPKTVENFVNLSKKGFYDGLIFHRVIPNFMIQGGCPEGRGTGGPGYKIDCELEGELQYHDTGVLSMAHAGRNTGGSQFFICHNRSNTRHLDRNHTCFGKVIDGIEIIPQIKQGDKIEKIVIPES